MSLESTWQQEKDDGWASSVRCSRKQSLEIWTSPQCQS